MEKTKLPPSFPNRRRNYELLLIAMLQEARLVQAEQDRLEAVAARS